MTDNIDFVGSETEPETKVASPEPASSSATYETSVKVREPAPRAPERLSYPGHSSSPR